MQLDQVTCHFCGETNPLPDVTKKEEAELRFDQKPVAASTAPEKTLHEAPAVTSTAPSGQERDPICPRCGKDNSKIKNARFCFSCGTILLGRQGVLDITSAVARAVDAVQQRDPICPRCGKDNSKIVNARFCFSCGTNLPTRQAAAEATPLPVPQPCPHCGRDLAKQPILKFCIYCGKPVTTQIALGARVPGADGNGKTTEPSQQPRPLHAEQATGPTPSAGAALPVQQQVPLHAEQTIGPAPGARAAALQVQEASSVPARASPLPPGPEVSRPAKPPVEPVDMLNITCSYKAPVLSAMFSKDGKEFFVGTARNEIIARQTTNARERRMILGERTGKAITVLAERDGNGFATCMSGTVMRFTRVALQDPKGRFTSQVKTSQAAILSVAVNPAGSRLILGGYDKNAEIYDLKAGKIALTLAGHEGAIDAVAFDPTGKLAATGGRDGDVKVWKAETGDLLRSFTGHEKPVLSLAFSHDCSLLASGSGDGSIKIWDPEKDMAVSTLKGHRGGVLALAFNNDGKRLVSGGEDTVARVWDVGSAKVLRTVEVHTGAINAIAISPDGKRVVTGGADKRSYHWLLEPERK
nr:zinc ribbon domain-containing protein [Candidatus Sigynarchaeum springense]